MTAMTEHLLRPDVLVPLLAALCAMATVLTLAMPFLAPDTLQRRMKNVAMERDRIRLREREKLAKSQTVGLRGQQEKAFVKNIVKTFRLTEWLGMENSKAKLAAAGFRGAAAESTLIFFRAVVPVVLMVSGSIYLFTVNDMGYSFQIRIGAVIALTYVGIKLPEIYLDNAAKKRRNSVRRAFPDALDLLLICVEAGISVEHAFRRVADEIGRQSVALAEELTLTTAELSYLPDRRQAYENLAKRVNVDSVKQIVTVLNQAEKYGTPLASALRVVAQESRDTRMAEAEKKAAALPPKLTVPMIVFFLPVLFVVIMGPAITQVMKQF
ncbi:MAG: Type secretion system protein [Hyphomicrobiales bacterium]|nr:Type secretion system protein [Hyphomicrobiales bacterium]